MNQQQYNEMFTAFQTNKILVEQFDIYLKQKCGHFYDEHLFQQLIELSLNNGVIDLECFINQYNETVDTLQYRSEILNNKIKELKVLNQQLSDQLNSNALQQNSLTIQIMDCQNIEIRDPSVYLQICCGAKTHKTRIIKGVSPQFQEQFEFPIDSGCQDIIITLFDSMNENMIGYTQFLISELREQKLKDISVNLQRQDNMKIKTKLHVILKFNHSKESLYKQEQQKLNHEINQNNIEMKETQQALNCLAKVFSGGCIKIRQLPPILEIKEFELKCLDTLNDALQERIQDWVPLFYKLTGLVVALSVMISLYRCQFMELTLLAIMMQLLILRDINQKWMRIFTYLFAVLFLYDLLWLYICGGSYGITKGEQHINKFVTALSYIELLTKIPFTIVLWKHSVEFEQFLSYFI
ncbi:unnamed protein product [Paramecium pentaurelia]|uniref:C2 domain-containing protein n=1 Tax=Paramecium pentaurelia TaxID=43138 RepID=A0A8S1UQ93_9CILI|nr:unnamed protein product [Paramecium pentaurelia]